MRQTIGGLDSLLRTLRAAGISVGTPELDRLRWVFAQAPALDGPRLTALLRCTLAKDIDQARRCDDLVRAWLGDADAVLREVRQPRFDDRPFVPPDPKPDADQRRWLVLAGVAVALATGILALVSWHRFTPATAPTPTTKDLPKDPVQSYLRWVGTIDVGRSTNAGDSLRDRTWLLLVPVLASFATGWWVLRAHKRADRPPAVPPLCSGPTHAPTQPPTPVDRALLSGAEARLAVASVDSFLAEEHSHRLDLAATVEATVAAGGIVSFVHERPRQRREVWLWRDHTAENPTAALLVGDFTTTLQRAGHHVQVGAVYGDLTEVTLGEGYSVAPFALDAHCQQALVGIFTDGLELERRLASATEGPAQVQALQALARWPHIALVDCGARSGSLPAIGRRFGIACLSVAEATQFVGLHHRRHRDHAPSSGNPLGRLATWAQALVLAPRAFSEGDALDVHERLGLDAPRHDLPQLLEHTEPDGLGYAFAPPVARRLRHWLALPALAQGATGGDEDTLLQRVAGYWLARCEREDTLRTAQQTAMYPWTDTEAQARLHLDRAFVQLWVDPRSAAAELDRLARRRSSDSAVSDEAPLAAEIRRRLARCTSNATLTEPLIDDTYVHLPWQWQQLTPRTQLTLWQLGFAAGSWRLVAKVRPDRRTATAWGLCVGVAIAVAACLAMLVERRSDEPARFLEPPPLPGLIQYIEDRGTKPALFGEPASVTASAPTMPGQIIALNWSTLPAENSQTTWSRGTVDILLPRPERWPHSSLAVIQATSDEVDARQLAIRLLDTGTVDRVKFHPGPGWEEGLRHHFEVRTQGFLFTREPASKEVFRDLVLGDSSINFVVAWHKDFAVLARELDRDGLATEVWAGHSESVSEVRVRGPFGEARHEPKR